MLRSIFPVCLLLVCCAAREPQCFECGLNEVWAEEERRQQAERQQQEQRRRQREQRQQDEQRRRGETLLALPALPPDGALTGGDAGAAPQQSEAPAPIDEEEEDEPVDEATSPLVPQRPPCGLRTTVEHPDPCGHLGVGR